MQSRLIKFFNDQKVLNLNQFGTINQFCTIISLIKNIQKGLDDEQVACGVFIDLEKAFDTVNHTLQLNKLSYYGIRGIGNRWFKSCLGSHAQYVSNNGFNSNYILLKYGVPQTSVLGPLLFLIFINDVNYAIKNSTTFHFADDTYQLNFKLSIKETNKSGKKNLKNLLNWLNANKISLNVTKTEVVVISRAKGKVFDTDLKLKMCVRKLYPSHHVKYLRVCLDKYINWATRHITESALSREMLYV